MKISILILFVAVVVASSAADCPPGEHNPGPDCSFEPICSTRSSHTYRRHYCDCWCDPPAIRDTLTNKCVKTCD